MSDEKYRIELSQPAQGIIEVTCEGYLGKGADEYIPRLEAMLNRHPGKVSLLFNTLSLTGYDFSFPMSHVGPFKSWTAKLDRVAVAHSIATIGFAIATVSLAAKTKIKGFPSRETALSWLMSPDQK